MNLTQQHLAPILASTASLLRTAPMHLEQFERWAHEQALRLKRAADQGSANLARESNLLRVELVAMSPRPSFESIYTERSEQTRQCQRLWLTALTDFVDDLLESGRGAAHHDLKGGVGAEGRLVEVSEALPGKQPYRLERVVERRG